MNSYELSRCWFNFCFENPEKIKPVHTAMYFFIIDHCNRLGWKEKFGLPMEMTKEAIGIYNYRTYSNTLKDLIEWGFVEEIQKSKNQYSSTIIAIVKNTKASAEATTKALDKAMQKQGQSIVCIDKPNNNKPNNNREKVTPSYEEFSDFALQKSFELKINLDETKLKLKFSAWVENGWKDGHDKPIKNWKSKLLQTLNYLKKDEQRDTKGTAGYGDALAKLGA